jgi:hypothetical protein
VVVVVVVVVAAAAAVVVVVAVSWKIYIRGPGLPGWGVSDETVTYGYESCATLTTE